MSSTKKSQVNLVKVEDVFFLYCKEKRSFSFMNFYMLESKLEVYYTPTSSTKMCLPKEFLVNDEQE